MVSRRRTIISQRILLYELETTNNGTRFQERAWRKDGIGTYATIIAHERTKLLESGRNAVPIHMHIHRVVEALVIVVAENGTSLHVHTQTDYAVAHEIEMSDAKNKANRLGFFLLTSAMLMMSKWRVDESRKAERANNRRR